MRLFFVSFFLLNFMASACVNSSYSRADEKKITNKLIHLILGQFAHRSQAFYALKVSETQSLLNSKPNDFLARNDLAVAYLKQGKWDLAEQELQLNEKLHPGEYDTAANLGVLYKKRGQFTQAAKSIQKSLNIKADGHMGLGDYYLLMCRNLAHPSSTHSFLGTPYSAQPEANAKLANKQHLISLIKNDYLYADTYFILGDVLFSEGAYQLAAHSYARATSLNHPGPIQERIELIVSKWEENKSIFEKVIKPEIFTRKLLRRIDEANTWLKQFQETETKLIHKQARSYTFNEIIWDMEEHGITRPVIIESGIKNLAIFEIFIALPVIIIITLALIATYFCRRKFKPA